MNDLSFNIRTSRDFFVKLIEEHEEYMNNKTSSRIALNFAMTSWHLTEWIYNEYNSHIKNNYSTLGLYQEDIKNQCPSLQIMHDIANGTKHYLLTRHKPIIKETNLHKGSFDSSFDRSFDISSLDVELNNGTKVFFEDEIEIVINFWEQYFKSTLNISV